MSKAELRAKKYLFIGIPLGALFSFISGFLLVALFRVVDKLGGTSIEWDILNFIIGCFIFVGLLYMFYKIVRDIENEEKKKK